MVKTALITGGASGIGKACVEKMAREGYGVVIADVNLAGAEALAAQLTAEGLSAMAVHMDVGSEEEVEAGFDKMMEAYGSCDLVMSNAGVQIVHPFDEYPFSDWKKMMSIHADGAFLVSRAAFRRMKASGKGGRIVFTGSVQSFVGSKLKEPYNFAKHGVAGLAKAIAREGAEYGIYTYTICPSFIKTPLVEKADPRTGAGSGYHGGRSGEEHHAAGYRGRRVHHRGGRGQHPVLPLQRSGRPHRPVPAADSRLGHDVICGRRQLWKKLLFMAPAPSAPAKRPSSSATGFPARSSATPSGDWSAVARRWLRTGTT